MNTSQEEHHLDEIRLLREENCRLKSLLDEHGIAWPEVEAEHATLGRMWEKRRRGYTDMGYEIVGSDEGERTSNLHKA